MCRENISSLLLDISFLTPCCIRNKVHIFILPILLTKFSADAKLWSPKHKYNWEDSGDFGRISNIKMPLHRLDDMKLHDTLYVLSSS